MIKNILLGKRYFRITDINDKARYLTMTLIFTVALVPLFMFGIVAASVLMYSPSLSSAVYNMDPLIKSRFLAGYLLILLLTIIFGYVNLLKNKEEEKLNAELAKERDGLKKEIEKATSAIRMSFGKSN